MAIGGIAGGIALGIASPEIAAIAGTAAIVAGIAYALVEAISAYIQFEEGVASDTRDRMQESVRSAARETEHALPDAIVAALAAKDLQKLLTRMRPLTPEAPAEASPGPELLSGGESTPAPTPEEPATTPPETEPVPTEEELAATELQGSTATHRNRFGLPSIEPVSIEFTPGKGLDATEFNTQMQAQEDGLNRMTVEEWLRNRDNFLQNNRAKEGDRAQKEFRERAKEKKAAELREADPDLSRKDARALAEEWISDKVALHDPDQVAGGDPTHITRMGDMKVNSSIGSQWSKKPPGGSKTRVEQLDSHIRGTATGMTPEEKASTYLNINLKR